MRPSKESVYHNLHVEWGGESSVTETDHLIGDETKEFLKEQTECPLCTGKLHILVEYDKTGYTLKEEARCSQCMALSRREDHLLH